MKNKTEFHNSKLINFFKNPTSSLKQIQKIYFNFRNYKVYNWFHLFLLIINAFVPFFELALAITTAIQENNAAYIWFTNWDTFTHQTNFMVFLFVWLSFWNPKNKFFKTNSWLIWTMTYIFITTLFFNTYVVMVGTGWVDNFSSPSSESSKSISALTDHIPYEPKDESSLSIFNAVSSIWFHLINPWVFIVYGFLLIFLCNKKITQHYTKYIILGVIYPIIYMAYLIYIPWSGFNDTGASSYSVYSVFTQTKYNNKTWLWFYPLFFIFPIVGTFLWWLNKVGEKVMKKKVESQANLNNC